MDLLELRALLRTMVLPPAGPLILAAIGLFLTISQRLRWVGTATCAAGIAALWLLATPVVAGHLTRWVARYPTLDLGRPLAAEAVVILAGGVRRYAPEYNDDAPSDVTLQRLTYGARVARVTGLPVLITGGRDEARAMRAFLIAEFNITPRWVENASKNTRDNAEHSAAILRSEGVGSVVLVSSASHVPRAAAEFRAQGLDVVPAPVTHYEPTEGILARWIPGIAGLRDSRNALYEVLGNVVYAVRRD